jgi:hypothetical protein
MATQNGTNDFDYLVGNDEDDILKGFRAMTDYLGVLVKILYMEGGVTIH